MSQSQIQEFERAVIEMGSRPVVVLGSSLSPDGRYGAVLKLLPTANDYVLNDLYVRTADGWKDHSGGNGSQWAALGDEEHGVLRFGGEAPEGATTARIFYEGREHVVPVRHGHFFFVAWETPYREEPRVVAFEAMGERGPEELPTSGGGGLHPGVDLDDSAGLLESVDQNADLLDRIPGARERIADGLADLEAGRPIPLDEL